MGYCVFDRLFKKFLHSFKMAARAVPHPYRREFPEKDANFLSRAAAAFGVAEFVAGNTVLPSFDFAAF